MHRSDGSGTTFIFTNYLSKVSPEWKSKVGASTAVEWPVGIGAKGNEGVANNVGQTKGAIGYVEYAYALQNKMASVDMINLDGKTVAPNAAAFQAAAANADWAKSDHYYVILTNQPGADTWPIAGATFILMYEHPDDTDGGGRRPQVLRLGLRQRRPRRPKRSTTCRCRRRSSLRSRRPGPRQIMTARRQAGVRRQLMRRTREVGAFSDASTPRSGAALRPRRRSSFGEQYE